ncbi:hypothetical protein [Maritalea sp.]|jgi:hypothetical protein|uniref:hypothetical protein n=1 Tax=Maritalea sp. TaxID=2003361 RepID=UPI0039E3A50D
MPIADQLASTLDRSDEKPNIELAQKLAAQSDANSEILELLSIVNNGTKALAHDAIKVLYELAALRPQRFGDKFDFILDLLATKDNRILWGSLTLISATCTYNAEAIVQQLPQILSAADRGSVIAKDNVNAILLQLASIAKYRDDVLPKLHVQLKNAAPNQLPMYAENAAKTLSSGEHPELVHILFSRLDDMPTPAKRARLAKAIAELSLPPKPIALT